MTAEPYTLEELPGVIADANARMGIIVVSKHEAAIEEQKNQLLLMFPRLLSTLEAMREDAERYRWLVRNVKTRARLVGSRVVPNHDYNVTAYTDEAIDAARREGGR